MGCSIQILFCSAQSHMSKIVLWHVLELFEPILFIPYTVLVLSDKIFACVSELFTKILDQKRNPTVPKHLRIVAAYLN